jgi:hypothetical protein
MAVIAPDVHVRPIWKLDLHHAATMIASTPGAKRIAINSEGPFISLADIDRSELRTIKLSEPARHVAIDSRGESLAIVSASHKLQVLGLESSTFGHELARLEAPVYDVCAFSRDDSLLWTVGLLPDDTAEIYCYDSRSWEIIGRHRFRPLIGGCGFILTIHPQEDLVGLWACGGPDEIWNYWIRLTTAGIELQHQQELDGSTAPCFNTRGDRFVVLNGYDLAAFSFPDCKNLYPPMTAMDENEDDMFAESMCYLDSAADDHVLASTSEGRIFVVALEHGEMVAEVVLEGHEPKPCYQVYIALSKTDDRLCSDLHSFISEGDNLNLSVHTNGRASNRRDTILLWRAPSGE